MNAVEHTQRLARIIARMVRATSASSSFTLLTSGGDDALLKLAVRLARGQNAWTVRRVADLLLAAPAAVRREALSSALGDIGNVSPVQEQILRRLCGSAGPLRTTTIGMAGIGGALRVLREAKLITGDGDAGWSVTSAGRAVNRQVRRKRNT